MSAHPPFALFEDNLGQPGHAVLLEDLQHALCCEDLADLDTSLARITDWQAQGWWVALAVHYELGLALEARLRPLLPAQPGPLLRAWAFASHRELRGDALEAWWRTHHAALAPLQRSAGILNLAPAMAQTDYLAAATRVLELIAAGDCYQVNLTFPLEGQYFGHPLALAARLREQQPVAHGVLLCDGQDWIISRSPELFVAREGERLRCRPMKGTVPREDGDALEPAKAALLSEKNRAENLMIVDLIRNDLGRLAPPGGVSVPRLFEVEPYRSVFQLTSTVEAAPVTAPFGEVLRALFPCGSVTGAPKIRAMEIIHTLESGPRGLYCGALGWLAPDGDFSLNVPIRTLLCSTGHALRLDVGSGIVADSDARAEHAECLTKARFATRLRDEWQLIETMRHDPAEGGIPLHALHFARLRASARLLGFTWQEAELQAALARYLTTLPTGPQRVRLRLSRDGTCLFDSAPLNALPGPQAVAWGDFRLDSGDPRLQHKTTARDFYDAALQRALNEGLFDLLFCNERDELCEGARSNVFVELDGEWLTPALHCGLLPGVLRASLLAQGAVREAVIPRVALARATRLRMGNALRGWVDVSLRA